MLAVMGGFQSSLGLSLVTGFRSLLEKELLHWWSALVLTKAMPAND